MVFSLVLGTATPGGGFPLFGDAFAEILNAQEPALRIATRNTKGSTENVPLLEEGKLDLALVAGEIASAALAKPETRLRIVTAIYSSPGVFMVRGDSPYRTIADLRGKPVVLGTQASGVTALGRTVLKALEIAKSGGRFIAPTQGEIERILARELSLQAVTLPANSYPGQLSPLPSVGSWSYVLASDKFPDDAAYLIARAVHRAEGKLAARLEQARETTMANTVTAAPRPELIHPGVRKYLQEAGLLAAAARR
jgi:hypothetical protein